jgi:hypothetical protein
VDHAAAASRTTAIASPIGSGRRAAASSIEVPVICSLATHGRRSSTPHS